MRYDEYNIEGMQPNPNPSWWVLVWIAIALAVGCAFSSCKTKTVVTEKVVDRYITKTDTIRDSIRNDVFINQYIKGDTVFRDRIETKYKYVYRFSTDTFIQRDSIPYIIEVEKVKEKKLNWLQKAALATYPYLFGFVVLVALGYVYVLFNKNRK